jgi:antitoxin ParD1/3/4
MAQMNISIPEPMKAWCEGQVSGGAYSTTSDYVRDLIRRDQERKSGIARLQAAIDEGFDSGISPYSYDEIITRIRAKYDH